MRALIGTSGFSYVEWRGSFYPEKMKPADMLTFYASQLATVELNNTFYRMPRAPQVAAWGAATGPDFRFVFKASRRITHFSKLADSEEAIGYLWQATHSLGDKLGPFLFQLPPTFQADLPRLTQFLAAVPAGMRAAFEFRHPSWFTNETYDVLRRAGAALCGGDVDEERKVPPLQVTADFGYLRLRRTEYAEADIEEWAKQITACGWRECYAFFKHEEQGPALARKLQALLA